MLFCVLICLSYTFTLFSWRVEMSEKQKILHAEIPLAFDDEKEKKKANEDEKIEIDFDVPPAIGVMPPKHVTERGFTWNSDDMLLGEAMSQFIAAEKLAPAIWLAMKLQTVSDDDKFKLVSEYYEKEFGSVYRKESEILKKSLRMNTFTLNSIPPHQAVAFAENLRFELLKKWIPQGIVNVMMQAFLTSEEESFVRKFMFSQLTKEVGAIRLGYSKEANDFFISRFSENPVYPGEYVRSRFDRFVKNLDTTEASSTVPGRAWLLSTGTKEQKTHLNNLIRTPDKPMTHKEYEELPHSVKYILATGMSSGDGAMNEALFRKTFSTHQQGVEWLRRINANRKLDGRVMSHMRNFPEVIEALAKPDYKLASVRFRASWKALHGNDVPDQIMADFNNAIELESKYWKELVSEKLWKHSFPLLPKNIWSPAGKQTFYNTIPNCFPSILNTPDELTLKRRAFMALIMLNRGEDPRFIHINAKITRADLLKYIDLKELKND